MDNNKRGIIYLIQPIELIKTNRYKIGKSCQEGINRCINGYKKGTRFLCINECINPDMLEKKIRDLFNVKYILIAGREYFEGDENDMIDHFNKIVSKHRKQYMSCIKNIPVTQTINNKSIQKLDVTTEQQIKIPNKNSQTCHLESRSKVMYNCDICEFKTKKKSNILKHNSSKKHNNNVSSFNQQVSTKKETVKDMSNDDQNNNEKVNIDNTKNSNIIIMNNDNANYLIKQYVCNMCKKQLSTKQSLSRHKHHYCKTKKNTEKPNIDKEEFQKLKRENEELKMKYYSLTEKISNEKYSD